MSDFPQQNPTLDKMSSRLGYAGAGSLSPILKGLKGRFTFSPDTTTGESLTGATIRCYNEDRTSYKDWSSSLTFPLVPGPSYYDGQVDVTFGFPSYTFSGAVPQRNILEWTTNIGTCRRQFWVVDHPTIGAVYVDNQEAQSGTAYVHVDPTATSSPPFTDMAAGDEDAATAWWDKNLMFSVSILPALSDEFFQQQEHYDKVKTWGNRYANTLRNWGGASTVEVFLDGGGTATVAERELKDFDGYFWGVVSEVQLGAHILTIRLRSVMGSATYVDLFANVHIRRFP